MQMRPDVSFGRQLKERRKALDLTQEELARCVGCVAETIRKIEADKQRPSKQIAELLAQHLAVPAEERTAFVRLARAIPHLARPAGFPLTRDLTLDEYWRENLSGQAIKGYELREQIGSGAFGVVYRAYQPLLAREVAIKVILPQHANHPAFIRRFDSESARFLAVVGPSGSGKSSLARAGLIPALRRGALPGSEHWFVVEVLPGAHPLEELEAALLCVAVNPPASLLHQLEEDERGLRRAVKRVLPADGATELVLVVDQFEEIFTLVEAEATRAHVLNSFLAAVRDPRSRVRVIITLRADFYDRPLLYHAFGDLLRQRTAVVLPLSADELKRAIVKPAERVGGQNRAPVGSIRAAPGHFPRPYRRA